MKKLSILIAVLAVVLCLFTGCATTDGNVSGSDSGSIGSDMPDNAPTDRPNTDDGAMTDPDSDTAPDSQAPGDGSEDNAAANGNFVHRLVRRMVWPDIPVRSALRLKPRRFRLWDTIGIRRAIRGQVIATGLPQVASAEII